MSDPSDYLPSADDLRIGNACLSNISLKNSETLALFSLKLSHLSSSSQKEFMQLIGKYSSLFSDFPTVTNVLEHDIDVVDHRPVKQNAYRVNPVKREIIYIYQKLLSKATYIAFKLHFIHFISSCFPWESNP